MEYHQKGNANFAWVEHMVSKLSMNGKAAIILANGSLSAGGQEEVIRKKFNRGRFSRLYIINAI